MSSGPVLVILAAGASSRLGQPKALVDLGGSSPMQRLFEAGAQSCGGEAILIAGRHVDALRSAAPAGLAVVVHPSWSLGRTGSVLAARRARPGRDLLIAPVDVPLVPREVFEQLCAEWSSRGAPARGWLAPAFREAGQLRSGHPVLIGAELAAELESFDPDAPLRELRDRAEPLWRVETASSCVLDDLDTPLDLKRIRDSLDSRS